MEKLTCSLCGYEFDRGRHICQGCHGRIKYGSGGMKWFYGLSFALLTFAILASIDEFLFPLYKELLIVPIVAFFFGMYKAVKKYKNSYSVEKVIS